MPLGIYRVQGNNKAMVHDKAYRDECVQVLQRYTPIIPEDLVQLNNRVTAKKLAVVGLGGHVQEKQRIPMKVIKYNASEQRYQAFEDT
ncbi:MAG: hypothetical protein RLN70_11690 [Rhodospirillaceae bacterium]